MYGRSVAVNEPPWLLAGSGGVVTTAGDLSRWLMFNLTGHGPGPAPPVLSAGNLALTHTPAGRTARYGMGWGSPTTGPRRIGHSGALFTFTANAALLPDAGYGMAVLANRGLTLRTSESDAAVIGRALVAIASGVTPRTPLPPGLPLDSVLTLLTLATAAAASAAVTRAGRWARRRHHDPWWRLATGLAPLALPAILFAALPGVVRGLSGRDLALRQIAYLSPALVLGLGAAAALAATVAAVRLVTLNRLRAASRG
jgi:hypothetical protein